MSSAGIYANIQSCQAQISGLSAAIVKQKHKIEKQDYAYTSCRTKSGNFLDELNCRIEKTQIINAYQTVAVFSTRYQDKTNAILSKTNLHRYAETVEYTISAMYRELNDNYTLLESMERQLQALEGNLAGLRSDYNRALAQEEAERQRQAAAACGNGKGK